MAKAHKMTRKQQAVLLSAVGQAIAWLEGIKLHGDSYVDTLFPQSEALRERLEKARIALDARSRNNGRPKLEYVTRKHISLGKYLCSDITLDSNGNPIHVDGRQIRKHDGSLWTKNDLLVEQIKASIYS